MNLFREICYYSRTHKSSIVKNTLFLIVIRNALISDILMRSAIIFLISIALFYSSVKAFIINFDNLSLDLFNIPYIILSVVFIVMLTIITRIILWTFTIYYMYAAHKTAWESVQKVISLCLRQWKETIIFLLINLGLGIAIGIATALAVIVLLLALVLAGAILFGIGFLIYKLSAVLFIPLMIIGIILLVILIAALIIGSLMISVPATTFFGYYQMDFMKSLIKKQVKTGSKPL